MSGGGKKITPVKPPDPAPAAMPIPGREEEEAKKKVKRRGRGRFANILASRLTSQRNNILKTELG